MVVRRSAETLASIGTPDEMNSSSPMSPSTAMMAPVPARDSRSMASAISSATDWRSLCENRRMNCDWPSRASAFRSSGWKTTTAANAPNVNTAGSPEKGGAQPPARAARHGRRAVAVFHGPPGRGPEKALAGRSHRYRIAQAGQRCQLIEQAEVLLGRLGEPEPRVDDDPLPSDARGLRPRGGGAELGRHFRRHVPVHGE